MNKQTLRLLIQRYLRHQGFRICSGRVLPSEELNKEKLRKLHNSAVNSQGSGFKAKFGQT
jgi:hypothetical protein